jgi:anti-sigma regulatory factor (Ser/Thr protein kinase)
VAGVLPSATDHADDHRQRLFQTTEPFTAQYPSERASVAAMRGEVTAIATRRGLTGAALSDVTLAISEAATNAVLHGSQRPGAVVGMFVGFERNRMQVLITDDGHGMGTSPEPSDKGYGLRIIHTVTKGEVVFVSSDQGTSVQMDFACPARGQYASLVRRRRPVRN